VEASVRGVRSPVLPGFAMFAILLVFAAGTLLWWPPSAPPDRQSDLGTALVGGGVIALAALFLEQRYAVEADRRDLLLTLGLGHRFVGIDLQGRDLSRAYLVDKDLSGARFGKAKLKGANLAGADLTRASLMKADCRGTNFRRSPSPLFPGPGVFPGPNVFPSEGAPAGEPQVGDATFEKTGVEGAIYDDSTRWPEDFDPDEAGAVHVKKRSLWWRLRHPMGRGL
jgi:hypothetical protein